MLADRTPGFSIAFSVRARSGFGSPCGPGCPVSVASSFGASNESVTFIAQAAPATPARDEQVIAGRNPVAGATVVNLSPAVAEELGLDPFAGPAVLVSKVAGGAAAQVGIRPGDYVRSVNGRQIRSVRDLTAAVSVNASTWQVTIERNGQQVSATFRS